MAIYFCLATLTDARYFQKNNTMHGIAYCVRFVHVNCRPRCNGFDVTKAIAVGDAVHCINFLKVSSISQRRKTK